MHASDAEKRFSRQTLLPEVGRQGQERLAKAAVFLVGAGGLASAAAYYLVAAGVGTIGIADSDRVEISNLNRQILHDASRIGMTKVASARQCLETFHPGVTVNTIAQRLTSTQALTTVFADYDLIIDCTDNFAARYRINAAAMKSGTPWIYGAASGFEGQVMTIVPGKGPCYRCLYPSSPGDTDRVVPVMGVAPGIVGMVQAAEAIKQILGTGTLLLGRMLFVDLLDMNFSELNISRNPNCPDCGH
ncbi:adenylyltransferase [Desulfosarcina ovata subsp. sediminis]|uniref:Adenylyltransferase n=1 Tax=Desulfosarcina ovata subsp. sediminis TaxID=885957 RepID=A0A5K8A1V6_9BACT|nr:HesA/MoeB/ThiF family protein [Desulfosarcina ovata]BBO86575.1 adenylyltransferase [Desulfosarcina ovata subsp. sediminis]